MSAPGKIRVLVVDDHAVVRVGVRTLVNAEPDMEVVAEAADAPATLAAYQSARPDVVLLDLRLPDISGAALIQKLRALDPAARIIVLTSYDAGEDVYQALRAGAQAYLLKGTFPDGILEAAIRRVHAGEQVIPAEVAARLAQRVTESPLSPREIAVLELVAKGLSNREIGAVLRTSAGTVKTHLKRIFVKLNVDDRTEAALLAVQRGLVSLRG
jgi:two-component system NarL family response regulator